jgi:hypothetical protein
MGKITVRVDGFEEILHLKEKTSTIRPFFSHTVILQCVETAPSEAVRPNTPDEHGMWTATKQNTRLNFSVPLQSKSNALPSSYWNEKIGGIKYIATACVDIKVRHQIVPPLTFSSELFVLAEQNLPNACLEMNRQLTSNVSRKVSGILRGEGKVHVQATVFAHSAKPVWISGGIGFIGILIKNESPLKVQRLTIELYRRFKVRLTSNTKTYKFSEERDQVVLPLGFSRIRVSKKIYVANGTIGVGEGGWWKEKVGLFSKGFQSHEKEHWKGVSAHSTSETLVDFQIPTYAYSVKNGVLIDVSYAIKVSVKPEVGYPY